jgi:PAS domain S-box-containing protein
VTEWFLVRRVKALVDVTQRLARGEQVMASAGGGGPAELEQLARAFDDMSAALQARHGALEQSGDSVMVANRDGVIEYVNAAFVRLTGFSTSEALGSTPRRVKRGQQTVDFYQGLWATVMSGTPFRGVFVNQRKDGSTYYEEQVINPVRDMSGAITHFVSIGRDISDRRRTEDALRRLNDRLEDETNRIASLLHDEAGQFLTACHITLADVSRDLPPAARERLREVRAHLDEVESQLRRLSHELRPRLLEDLGLVDALKFLAEGTAKRAGIEIQVHATLETRCPPPIETAVYRLVQESLTNIMKHARAKHAQVTISQDAHAIHCTVSDDGVGFDMNSSPQFGLGLLNIQDRIEAVRGTLRIESRPGRGTALHTRVPLERWDAVADPPRRTGLTVQATASPQPERATS